MRFFLYDYPEIVEDKIKVQAHDTHKLVEGSEFKVQTRTSLLCWDSFMQLLLSVSLSVEQSKPNKYQSWVEGIHKRSR